MRQIFINLPVRDVDAAMEFYQQLGFTVNPLFSFDDQKCMVWSDHIYVMLQTHVMFGSGIRKPIADAKQNTLATFTLPVESMEKVNEIMEKGLQAGGTEATEVKDEPFMHIRNIEDPDGHNWAIIYLDMEKFKETTGKL